MNETEIKALKHWGRNMKAVSETIRYLRNNPEEYHSLLVRDLLRVKGFSTEADDCAYCSRYFSFENNSCVGCPIYGHTGETHCYNTPWVEAGEHAAPLLHGDNKDIVEDLRSLEWLYESAKGEFKFLKTVNHQRKANINRS